MMHSGPPSSVGSVIAQKYRLDREIGRGGMGVVYAATDLTLGRTVALKLLLGPEGRPGTGRSATTTSREDTARFMREARATASLRGEHVVEVYEAGATPGGVPFLAMELLHGEDLERYVARCGPLPIAHACDLLIQACVGLDGAHQLGIVHRDLKPQNFFVLPARDPSGPRLKVLDFGISKMSSEADLALTQTSMTMGSPRYMSPEQVRSSKHVDWRSDLWALGAVLFEALGGRPLFDEQTASALYAQIIADPATPLRRVRHDAPPALELVILRCVDKDPTRRWGSAAELAQALAPFAGPLGRAAAARLAAKVGLRPAVEEAAVRHAAGAPAFGAAGVSLAGTSPTSAKRPALVWPWIVVAAIAFVCVVGAALSGVIIGAMARADSSRASDPTALDAGPAPTPPSTADSGVVVPRVVATADAGTKKRAAPDPERNADDARRATESLEANDQQRAFSIRQQTDADAHRSCETNQFVVNDENVPARGDAVAASVEACRTARDAVLVDRIRGQQRMRVDQERTRGF